MFAMGTGSMGHIVTCETEASVFGLLLGCQAHLFSELEVFMDYEGAKLYTTEEHVIMCE